MNAPSDEFEERAERIRAQVRAGFVAGMRNALPDVLEAIERMSPTSVAEWVRDYDVAKDEERRLIDERIRAEKLRQQVERAVRDIRAGIPVRLIEGDPAIPLVREALKREDEL